MGDRVNIAVQDQGQRVYFYGHWRGYIAPAKVQAALAKRSRWDDPSYLARIVFCEFIKGVEDEESGFGISTRIEDNEHPIIVVNCNTQRVEFEADPERDWIKGHLIDKSFSFEDFISIKDASWDELEAIAIAKAEGRL